MTDRRLTDLSYGHPGRATYDVEEHRWVFSVKHDEGQNIRQILPFKQCISPCLQTIPHVKGSRHSHKLRRQLRQLAELNPEVYPGFDILNSISKNTEESDVPTRHGNIFVTGRAMKRKRISRFVATPCGEAGHILRLVESQNQLLGWETSKGTVVTSEELNPASQGFWTSVGGTIRQICSSIDADETSTWLAVRQDAVTTIFRPYFTESQCSLPSDFLQRNPSRLVANPVASLTTGKTHLLSHEDVSFNPWYTQQLILVDTNGCWGIWDIERQRKASFSLVAGKSGRVTDGIEMDQTSVTSYLSEDGWYRALWVSTLATIVVCSRHLVAVFDVTARPARLQSMSFTEAGEQILDIKRSFSDKSHLFVLTNNRIFWIEVTSGDGDGQGEIVAGARVLLSYRHYRDPFDETLALSTINDDQVPILISSGKTPILNAYGFAVDPSTRESIAWQGSFVLSASMASNPSHNTKWKSLHFEPLPFVAGLGEDDSLADNNVRFLQVWVVSSDIAVYSTICIAYNAISRGSTIPVFLDSSPTVLLRTKYRRHRPKRTQSFILKDSDSDEESRQLVLSHASLRQHTGTEKRKEVNPHPTIDWRHIFHAVFKVAERGRGHSSSVDAHPALPTLSTILEALGSRLIEARQSHGVPRTSLFEMTSQDNISEELDRASAELLGFLRKTQNDDDDLDQFEVAISNIGGLDSTNPGGEFDLSQSSPIFLDIYDHLVDIWMSALPLDVSVQSRLSKYNRIRGIATSLCFSSIGISIQPRVPDVTEWNNHHSLVSPEMTPDPSRGSYSHLSTPSYRSSSQSLVKDAPDSNEDLAITRLRKYAVSIQSQPVREPSKLLSEWVPGIDPASYTWQDPSRTSLTESTEEDARRKRRAESKRKKLKENLTKQITSMRAATVESQSSVGGIGSQPLLSYDTFSSQPVVEIPMTQPLGGTFGSRLAQNRKRNKAKQRRAGF